MKEILVLQEKSLAKVDATYMMRWGILAFLVLVRDNVQLTNTQRATANEPFSTLLWWTKGERRRC